MTDTMTDDTSEFFEDVSNPLDCVEEIMSSNDWNFSRVRDDEIEVQVSGRQCDCRLLFMWQEEFSALQFQCQIDMTVSRKGMESAGAALMEINRNLWLGHFDIPEDTRMPVFRQTCLFRGQTQSSGADHLEDLVEIALAECERFYPAFHLLGRRGGCDDASLSLALMDTEGES